MAKKRSTKKAKTSKKSHVKKVENKKDEKPSLKTIIPTDTNSLVTFAIFLLIGLIIGSLISYGAFLASGNTGPSIETDSVPTGNLASVQQEAEDYLNTNLLNPQAKAEGVEYTLDDGNDLGNGLYEFGVYVDQNGQEQLLAYVYSTEDKLILGQGKAIDLSEDSGQESTGSAEPTEPTENAELEKQEVASAELYVWGYCPAGIATLDTFADVAYNLQSDANIGVVLFHDGHGAYETQQNKIQAAIQVLYPEKYWDYARDFYEDVYSVCSTQRTVECDLTESSKLMEKVGIDTNSVMTLVEEQGEELVQLHRQKAQALGISASPSIVINGTSLGSQFNRSAEGIQSLICSGFIEESESCSIEFSAEATAAGSC